MYIHVYTLECRYHVCTMYIHVYTFAEMYIHVCTSLCFPIIVYTMSVSCCTIAWYIHCTLITARSRTGMLVRWVLQALLSSLCYLIGFCLSFTLLDLKVWIYLYYLTTGASLTCTAHLRMIRWNNLNTHVLLHTYAHNLCYYINYINYINYID